MVGLSRFFGSLKAGEYERPKEPVTKPRSTVFVPSRFKLDNSGQWVTFFVERYGEKAIPIYDRFVQRQTDPSQSGITDGSCFVDNGKFYCEFLKRRFEYRASVPHEGIEVLDLQNLVLIADNADGLDIMDAKKVDVKGRDLTVWG